MAARHARGTRDTPPSNRPRRPRSPPDSGSPRRTTVLRAHIRAIRVYQSDPRRAQQAGPPPTQPTTPSHLTHPDQRKQEIRDATLDKRLSISGVEESRSIRLATAGEDLHSVSDAHLCAGARQSRNARKAGRPPASPAGALGTPGAEVTPGLDGFRYFLDIRRRRLGPAGAEVSNPRGSGHRAYP